MERDYKELYEKITESDWFKKAYQDKSLGKCPIVVEGLEESKDEKIRKALIKDFRNYYEMYDKSCGEPKWGSDCLLVKDILDWLERKKEQKPVTIVRIPKFRVGDIIQHVPLEKWDRSARVRAIDENGYHIDYTHIGDSVSGGYIGFSFENEYELVEQKPAEWSEEDKEILNDIIVFISGYADKRVVSKWVEFLKSICHQSKQEVPKDAETLTAKLVNLLKSYRIGEETATTLANRIADTYGAQRYLDGVCDASKQEWKPSKEQIEALWNTLHPDDPYYVDLSSLYDDLKKL